MNGAVPRRVTVVFAGLGMATFLTWWLGSRSAVPGVAADLAATLTLLIAFTKVLFIGRDFMELRLAPPLLRNAFTIWVVAVATGATVLILV